MIETRKGFCAAKILELYPLLAETHAIDVILPKKESAVVAKWYVIPLKFEITTASHPCSWFPQPHSDFYAYRPPKFRTEGIGLGGIITTFVGDSLTTAR